MEGTNNDNNLKWPSIPLLIANLHYYVHKGKKNVKELNKILFETSFAGSQKYDGTNVGRDNNGLMYGRNQLIPSTTKSYQKTPLDYVMKIDGQAVLDELLGLTGITKESIEVFNLYGELMCNKDLYDYSKTKVSGTHQLFGAIIKPKSNEVVDELLEKLAKANFACRVKVNNADSGDDEEEVQAENEKLVIIYMNQAYKELIEKFEYPLVPLAGTYKNFYELVVANFDWMVEGRGEGIVCVTPDAGGQCKVSKWKIGAEASSDNGSKLDKILETIEGDKDKEIFGENTEKAIELIEKMLKVNKSKLINGAPPVVKTKEAKKAAPKKNGPVELTAEEKALYEEAIKSAKTKFDHADTFFAKNMKGVEEYSQLITKECLNDIKIDAADKAAMDKHTNIVKAAIKEDFVAFKKANGGKK